MTEEDKAQAIDDIDAILRALEPWLYQRLKANPDPKYLDPVRLKCATRLFEILEGATKK